MARWQRRLAWTAGGVLLLWAVGWLGVPPLLKWQLQQRGSEALGRALTVESVGFHPWNLDLTLQGVAIAALPSAAAASAATTTAEPLLRIGRVRGNVSAASLWRAAPVIEALEVDDLQLHVARLAEGHYDIDDLITRFTPRPDTAPSKPARFALYNVQVRNAQARFDDRPVGRVHAIEALHLTLPFLSDLPAQVEIKVEPRLAFKLNGVAFDSGAQATPFAQTRRASLDLKVAGFDVLPYLGYLPRSLPLRLTRGTLDAALTLQLTQPADTAPTVALHGSAAAKDLMVTDTAGAPLLAWRELRLGLRDVQPLARKLAFDTLRIEGAQIHLRREADGRIALPQPASTQAATRAAPAAAAAGSAAASASASSGAEAWQVSAAAIELADARLLWSDASVSPTAALQLDGISVQAKDVAWPAAAPIPLSLSATLRAQGEGAAAAGQLKIEGTATDSEAKLQANVSELALDALAPYAALALSPRLQGRVSAKAQLDWSGGAAAPRLKLDLSEATLNDLRVVASAARTPAAAGASLTQLLLGDVQVDLLARTVVLGQIKLTQPMLNLARDARGELNVVQWLAAPKGSAAPVPPDVKVNAAEAQPWHVTLRKFALERGQVRWTDAAARGGAVNDGEGPLRLDVQALQLGAQQLEWHGERAVKPGKLQLSARIGGATVARDGGAVEWKGDLGVQPLQASGELRIERFPVHALEAYFAAQLPVSLLRAEAGYSGQLAMKQTSDGLDVSGAGDVLLGNVHVNTLATTAQARAAPTGGADELLTWQSLAIRRAQFAMKPGERPRLQIGEAVLSDFYSRLVVTEQGRFNLQPQAPAASAPAAAPAVPSAAASTASAAAAAATAADDSALPLDLSIGVTQLINGRIDFSDHFVRPNYSAELTDLNGQLGALSSTSREMATLQLRGRVAGTGALEISGQLNPTVRPLALDVKARATDLELAPLSPYAGKYAGYAIDRGKLSVDVAYKIDPDGKLEARNQVVLNQLTFGQRIESPDATKLPVLLAVALLKDRNGVIDLNLPISGSINDPQFSIAGIVVKLIVNLLVKALTSPFALLGGGGSGEDLSFVDFVPGTAAISAGGQQTLDKVAKALNERPALKMTVTGWSDPDGERSAYRRAALEARLLAERSRQEPRASAAASAPAALTGAERSRALQALYRQTDLPNKPRNVIGLAKDISDAEMEALLLEHMPAPPDAMRDLAQQRGLVVRDALVAKGLPSERLLLAAPKIGAAGAAGAASAAAGGGDKDVAAAARAQLSLAVN